MTEYERMDEELMRSSVDKVGSEAVLIYFILLK